MASMYRAKNGKFFFLANDNVEIRGDRGREIVVTKKGKLPVDFRRLPEGMPLIDGMHFPPPPQKNHGVSFVSYPWKNPFCTCDSHQQH